MQLIVAILGAVSLASVLITRRYLPPAARLPCDVYWGLYTLTVFVGAVVIGLPQTRDVWLLYSLPFGLDGIGAPSQFGLKYWLLVFAPYLVPPVSLLYVHALAGRAEPPRIDRRSVLQPGLVAAAAVIVGMTTWCVLALDRAGYLGVSLLGAAGGYQENILQRYAVFAMAGDLFFRFSYVGLPAMSVYCLFRSFDGDRRTAWIVWAIFAFLAATYFYLSSFQKAYVLVLIMAIGLVLMHRRVVGYKGVLIFGAAMFSALVVLSYGLSSASTLNAVGAAGNILFRIPSALPFYEGLFPDVVRYAGLDVGLKRFNVGPDFAVNQLVATYMFPVQTWVQGASPAPAHFMAYAEGGPIWSIATLLIIGAFMGVSGLIGCRSRTSFGSAVFVSTCIALYYQTQTGFWPSIQASYGLVGALLPLLSMLAIDRFLRLSRAGFQVVTESSRLST